MDFTSYITGFVDGEGCFSVSFTKRSKLNVGIEVRPSFAVGQNKRSREILERIARYFSCGSIRFSAKDQLFKYEVRNLTDLRKRIIPHFNQYPLQTNKSKDFELFKNICEYMAQSKHLNPKFLRMIIHWSYQMNGSGKRKYTEAELLHILDKMKI